MKLGQTGERQPCVRAAHKRHPLHDNLRIVCFSARKDDRERRKGWGVPTAEERDLSLMSLSNWRAAGARQPYESRTKGTKLRPPCCE